MNELERKLQLVRLKEPSAHYLERGLAHVDAYEPQLDLVSTRWRYAAIGLAVMLVASLALNGIVLTQATPDAAPDMKLVSSEFRLEGDLLIREMNFEIAGTEETSNE